MLFLSGLAFAVGLVSGGIGIYEFIIDRKRPGTLFVVAAIGILLAAYLIANQPAQSASGRGITPTPPPGNAQQVPGNIPGQPTPTSILTTPTPTPNPCSTKPNSGTVLYQADWSKDTNGWIGAGDWTALNGALVTAGDGTPPIFASYHPGDNCIADYAIEAKITVIKYNDQQEDGFGLVARATSDGGGYTLSICAKEHYAFGSIVASCADDTGAAQNIYKALLLVGQNFPDGGTVLGGQAYKAHVVQHVYRLEVKANTITAFIDGNRVIGPVTDNTYLSGGQVGVYSENTQLSLDSFQVIAL
jgi:hypothetical protein